MRFTNGHLNKTPGIIPARKCIFFNDVHMLVLGLFNSSFLNGSNVSTILFEVYIVILIVTSDNAIASLVGITHPNNL